jgi:hypothetical protein
MGAQILFISHEYHLPYKKHQKIFFDRGNSLISFVTHHQLMQRQYLYNIFGYNGERLLEWISLANYMEPSAMSEYDTYGEYVTSQKEGKFVFSKWDNFATKADDSIIEYSKVKKKFGKYCSVSFHGYL